MKEFFRLQKGEVYAVITKSGTGYHFRGEFTEKGIPVFYRNGERLGLVAIRPSLIANFGATKKFAREQQFLSGYNAAGNRTFRILPAHIELGMIFVSGKGHQSTPIVDFHHI